MATSGIGSQQTMDAQQKNTEAKETTTFNVTQYSEGMSETARVVSSANPPALLGGSSDAPSITV